MEHGLAEVVSGLNNHCHGLSSWTFFNRNEILVVIIQVNIHFAVLVVHWLLVAGGSLHAKVRWWNAAYHVSLSTVKRAEMRF